jgi:hypothetical protein
MVVAAAALLKCVFITAYEIYFETLKKEFPTCNTVGCLFYQKINWNKRIGK